MTHDAALALFAAGCLVGGGTAVLLHLIAAVLPRIAAAAARRLVPTGPGRHVHRRLRPRLHHKAGEHRSPPPASRHRLAHHSRPAMTSR